MSSQKPTGADKPLPPCAHAQFDVGSTDDSLECMARDFAELGHLYRVYAPGRKKDTWVVSDPEAIKRVLVSNHRNYTMGVGMDRVKVLVGNGIIVTDGEVWQRQHRMVQPMFQRSKIERFAPLFAEVTRRRLENWQRLADTGELLNITKDVSESALEVVLRAMFGEDLDRMIAEHGGNPFALLTEESERDLRFAFRFRQLTTHIIKVIERRTVAGATVDTDWLGMMMAARDRREGAGMSQRELLDEIMSLIVAGHETTAAVLNATWYLLSQHPEEEARLHAEVDTVGELTNVSFAALDRLTFTRHALLEALRLYPPVWVLTRRCTHADKLAGFEAPAGADVFMSPYLVQRDPKYWDDPNAFCPERFADDEADDASPHRFSFIPFAAGPRHCVGETFAMYEMIVHMYFAARRFKLSLPNPKPIELEARINLRIKDDLLMRVQAR